MLDSLSLKADQGSEAPKDLGRKASPEELFDAHFEAVHRYFARRTSSAEDAQDLTAETFAATVGNRMPRNIEPLSWLYGIARRKLADHLRKRKPLAPAPSAPGGSSERAVALRVVVDRLPRDQREALLLQVLEELGVMQIGEVMGRSQGSVKALLQRAKERVRAEFEQEEGVWI